MSVGPGGTLKGLKALKKESRSKLDAYQHLFYHLQTDPTYLAKLIFAMPQSSRYRFIFLLLSHCQGIIYYIDKLGGIALNGNKLK